MKTLRKIITNRKPLTDEDILSQKEGFLELKNNLSKVKTSAKIRNIKYAVYGIAASIAIIVFAYNFLNKPAHNNIIESEYIICDTSYFKKPITELSKYQHFTIDNKKGADLQSSKGSKIHIKANTFIDKNGNIVDGNVEVIYNEYHNPVELFLSGIPMKYDSAGMNYTFESAGMFEIYAKKDTEFLAMNEKQPIQIDLVSSQYAAFNLYYYDTKENKWMYLNNELENNISEINSDETENITQKSDYTLAPASTNLKDTSVFDNTTFIPRKANTNNYSFVINVDSNEFPEFVGYNKMLFEIDNTDSSFREEYYDVKWSKVDLKKLDNDKYLIQLSRFKKTVSVKAYPVLNNEDYDKAINVYNNNMKEQIANMEMSMKKISDKAESQKIAEIQKNIMTNFQYYRNLSITNLGTYNCDRPMIYPEYPIPISLNVTDKDGNKLYFTEVNIIQRGKNILWKYPNTAKSYISKSSYNIIWIHTESNQLAIIEIPENSNKWKLDSHTPQIYSFKEGIEKISKIMDNVL